MMLRRLLFILCLWSAQTARAQNSGGTESVFSLGAGSRELSLGGANMAQTAPTTAYFWNVARLATAERLSMSAFHSRLFEPGVTYSFAGLVLPTLDYGTFGFGIVRHGVSGIDKRDAGNLSLGEIHLSQLRMYIAYGRQFSNLDFGISASVDYQSLDTYRATSSPGLNLALSRRFELSSEKFPSLTLAIQGSNLIKPGVRLVDETYSYPRSVTAGVTINVLPSRSIFHRLQVSTSLQKTDDLPGRVRVGLEYSAGAAGHVRSGLNGGRPSIGAGVSFRSYSFDYAMIDRELGSIHMFTLTSHFGLPTAERREIRAEQRERDFRNLMRDRFQEKNRALMESLVEEGESYLATEQYAEATSSLQGALLIARSTQSDTVMVAELARTARNFLEARNRSVRYTANIDSAEAAMDRRDLLAARYFANLALEDDLLSTRASDILKQVNAALSKTSMARQLVSDQVRKLDSLLAQGRFAEAEALVNSLVDIAPDDDKVRLAAMQFEFKRWQKAMQTEEQRRTAVAASVPDSTSAAGEGTPVDLRSDQSTPVKVAEPLSPAMKKEVDASYASARHAFEAGDLQQAITTWEKVERLAPDYLSTRQFLIRAYKFVGVELYAKKRRDDAVIVWRKAARLDPDDQEVQEYIKHTVVEIQKLKKLSYDGP